MGTISRKEYHASYYQNKKKSRTPEEREEEKRKARVYREVNAELIKVSRLMGIPIAEARIRLAGPPEKRLRVVPKHR